MAANNLQTSLKVDDEDKDEELQFRDSFPGFSDAPILDDEEHAKLLPNYEEEQPEKVSFWEFKYYQNLFNVDTKQVMERIIWSAIPRPGGATYLHRLIRPNPDLYGPFWICITLVFTIAVSSNIAEYLQSLGTEKAVAYYDYRKVTFSATTLFSYTFLLPLAIWGFLWYFESTSHLTILEVICLYGYSLAVYIPISILWIVKVVWLQVGLILLGFSLSTSVMMLTFWPAARDTRRKISTVLLLVICLFHALLCFGFSVYFFEPHHLAETKVMPSVTTPKTIVTTLTSTSKHESYKETIVENLKSVNLVLTQFPVDSLTTMGDNGVKVSNVHLKEDLLPKTLENNSNEGNSTLLLEGSNTSNNSKLKAEKTILNSQPKTANPITEKIHSN